MAVQHKKKFESGLDLFKERGDRSNTLQKKFLRGMLSGIEAYSEYDLAKEERRKSEEKYGTIEKATAIRHKVEKQRKARRTAGIIIKDE